MTNIDFSEIAARLTQHERTALRSLPVPDRGHLPDELWWAYRSILDYGLASSNGDFVLIASPLGQAVLRALESARS